MVGLLPKLKADLAGHMGSSPYRINNVAAYLEKPIFPLSHIMSQPSELVPETRKPGTHLCTSCATSLSNRMAFTASSCQNYFEPRYATQIAPESWAAVYCAACFDLRFEERGNLATISSPRLISELRCQKCDGHSEYYVLTICGL